MNLRSAIEIGLVGLGIAGGGVTFYNAVLEREAIQALQKSNAHLEQRITDTEVAQKGVRLELTNEEVERCLTDNVVKDILGVMGVGRYPTSDCSDINQYSPQFSPDNIPNRTQPRPNTQRPNSQTN